MSVLLGTEIIEEYNNGKIIISPFKKDNVGPNSLDVTLSNKLVTYIPVELVYRETLDSYIVSPLDDPLGTILDMAKENKFYEIEIPDEGVILVPGILYLGMTNEKAGSDHFIPMYEGRSSLARLGIQSHLSAGFGDICFKSNWTLEISVIHPTKIYHSSRIGQVYFHKVDEDARLSLIDNNKFYAGKYTNQPTPQPSKSYLDFNK